MSTLTVQQVAADRTGFAAHLQGLSTAQVFATPVEADAALRDTWLSGHSPIGFTRLDPHGYPETSAGWDEQTRTRLVAATWPGPYATPVHVHRLRDRTQVEVREDVAALLHRLRAQYPEPVLDLLAAADQHPMLDGPTVRRLFDGQHPLDAATLLDVIEYLRLDVTPTGWTANPTRLRADLARYAQVATIAAAIPVHEYDPVTIHQVMGDQAQPPHPASKYRALFEHLDALDGAPAAMTFGQVDLLLRSPRPRLAVGGAPGGRGGRPEKEGLTRTAHSEGWWATTVVTGNRSHQRAWTAAGYRATKVWVSRRAPEQSQVLFVPFDEVKWALWSPLRHALRAGTGAVPLP